MIRAPFAGLAWVLPINRVVLCRIFRLALTLLVDYFRKIYLSVACPAVFMPLNRVCSDSFMPTNRPNPAEDLSRTDRKSFVLEDPEQIAAMRSQVRQMLVGTLCRSGPMSVPELAERLGKSDKSLYHHVKVLVECGLIYEYDQANDGRYTMTRYMASHNSFVFPREPKDDATLDLIMEIFSSGFRAAVRAIRSEVKGRTSTRTGPGRNLASGRFHGWLTADELAKINESLDTIMSLMSVDKEQTPGATHFTINFAFHRTPGMNNKSKEAGDDTVMDGEEAV